MPCLRPVRGGINLNLTLFLNSKSCLIPIRGLPPDRASRILVLAAKLSCSNSPTSSPSLNLVLEGLVFKVSFTALSHRIQEDRAFILKTSLIIKNSNLNAYMTNPKPRALKVLDLNDSRGTPKLAQIPKTLNTKS